MGNTNFCPCFSISNKCCPPDTPGQTTFLSADNVTCTHLLAVFFRRTLGIVIGVKHFVEQEVDLPCRDIPGKALTPSVMPHFLCLSVGALSRVLKHFQLWCWDSASPTVFSSMTLKNYKSDLLKICIYPLRFVREWSYLETFLHNYCGHVFL